MLCSLSDLDHSVLQRGATAREPNLGEDSSFSSSSCCALEDGYPRRARRSSRSTGRQRQLLTPGRHLLLLLFWATAVSAVDPKHLSTSPSSACCSPMLLLAPHETPHLADASITNTPPRTPLLWADVTRCWCCESSIADFNRSTATSSNRSFLVIAPAPVAEHEHTPTLATLYATPLTPGAIAGVLTGVLPCAAASTCPGAGNCIRSIMASSDRHLLWISAVHEPTMAVQDATPAPAATVTVTAVVAATTLPCAAALT